MLIDWFTVGAQVVNFLILLVLLKIFLFDRIKQAMDQRENNIKERFDKAGEQEAKAKETRDTYEKKTQSLQDEWDARLKEADKEAKERRESLIKEAREEVDGLKNKWQNALEQEKASFFDRFKKQAARLIFDTVEKTLYHLADTRAQDQAVKRFLSRFEALEKEDLPKEVETQPRVSTGFELSESQQKSIQKTVSQKLPDLENIAFEVRPELVFGIAFAAGGKKMTWHAHDYVSALEKQINQAIESKDHEPQKQ
jgi:F-type H+-transporting ATPase subunit b